MNKLVSTILGLLLLVNLLGQASIQGSVIHHSDGSPIVGASIYIDAIKTGTSTDTAGFFQIDKLVERTYTLRISSIGFSDKTIEWEAKQFPEELTIALAERIFNLPQVVVESVTMTGGLASVKSALGSAHYISQQEIQKFSYTDINRTLRHIPGVNIQEEDGYGLRPNIGLRASGSERSSKITIMEDGILASPAPYSAPAAYYFPTIGRMEAIEIMKGSSQIKYGPFTTGGAINLISTPIPTEFAGHADFIIGSDAYRMLHANLGNAHNNFSYMVETMQYSSDGFKKLDNGDGTGFNKEDYLAKFRLNTNADAKNYQSLTFKIGQSKERSNETYLGLSEEDFQNTPMRRYAGSQKDLMTTHQNQLSLTHFISISPKVDLFSVAYHNTFGRNWYKLDKVSGQRINDILTIPDSYKDEFNILNGSQDSEHALSVKANNRNYKSKGIQSHAVIHFTTSEARHKFDIGLRFHNDEVDRFQWVDQYSIENKTMKLFSSGVPGTESNRIEKSSTMSIFGQYKIEWPNLTIQPGLRHEYISMVRRDYGKSDIDRTGNSLTYRKNRVSVWIPGVGLSYRWLSGIKLFGGVHKGFAPPGSKEGTLPEESWNLELGWRNEKEGIQYQFLIFSNYYSNLLGSDLAATGGQGTQDLFNGGKAVSRGAEIELSYEILRSANGTIKIPMFIAYTYSDSRFKSDFDSDFSAWGKVSKGDHLPYVPKHQLALGLSAEHHRFLFDISVKYSSPMLSQAGEFHDSGISRTDAAFTMDIALNYKLSAQISAFANINNATNNVYVVSRRPAGLRPNLPRSYNLGLKANF